MSLSDEEIKRIGLGAAERIFGVQSVVSLDTSVGPDWSGDLVRFLEFTLEQDRDRATALNKRSSLRAAILDDLAAAGDEMYPHVGIHNRVPAPTGAGGELGDFVSPAE